MTGTPESTDDPYDELHQRIGAALVRAAPPGWDELRARHVQVGRTSEVRTWAVVPDQEETIDLDQVDVDLLDALEELREATYREHGAVWYTAYVLVTRDLRIGIDLDYDSAPAWEHPVPDDVYQEDVERYPRDEAQLPGWLVGKVRADGA